MSDIAVRLAAAAALLWLGMVMAISFLEAPLKFRAAGLDLRVGVAIGRIVFRALNRAEIGWALVIALCLLTDPQSVMIATLATIAGGLLLVQLALVRPRLNRRTDQVLGGSISGDAPRSRAHHVYIVLETLNVATQIMLGGYLLSA